MPQHTHTHVILHAFPFRGEMSFSLFLPSKVLVWMLQAVRFFLHLFLSLPRSLFLSSTTPSSLTDPLHLPSVSVLWRLRDIALLANKKNIYCVGITSITRSTLQPYKKTETPQEHGKFSRFTLPLIYAHVAFPQFPTGAPSFLLFPWVRQTFVNEPQVRDRICLLFLTWNSIFCEFSFLDF